MVIFLFTALGLLASQVSGNAPSLLLNDGNSMPVVGLGTFGHINDPDRIVKAVVGALQAGYRHIDVSPSFLNEEYVGRGIAEGIKQGIVTRDELFVSIKLDPRVSSRQGVVPSIQSSLRKLQLDFADLFLILSPLNAFDLTKLNDVVDIWKGMEEARGLGLAKSIGVANFDNTLLNLILDQGNVPPAVNQIEVNPTLTNSDTIAFCHRKNIAVIAIAPQGFLVPRAFSLDANPGPTPDDPLLIRLSNKYGVTVNQIVLRYLIDRGIAIVPKSYTISRIRENIDIFSFGLTQDEVLHISNFNRDIHVYIFNYDTVDPLCQYMFGLTWAQVLERIGQF